MFWCDCRLVGSVPPDVSPTRYSCFPHFYLQPLLPPHFFSCSPPFYLQTLLPPFFSCFFLIYTPVPGRHTLGYVQSVTVSRPAIMHRFFVHQFWSRSFRYFIPCRQPFQFNIRRCITNLASQCHPFKHHLWYSHPPSVISLLLQSICNPQTLLTTDCITTVTLCF